MLLFQQRQTEEKEKIQRIRKKSLPISPLKHREAKFATMEVREGKEVVEYRLLRKERRGRRFPAAAQQTSANLQTITEQDLSSFFRVALTQNLSHTSHHYWSWMAACTFWKLTPPTSPSLPPLMIHHPAVVPMKSPSSFQINVSPPSHLRESKLF